MTMAGARKGYEVFDNSWSLSLALENSHLNQLHCAGVSKDRKMFFDLLEYDIGLCILSVLGAPVTVINAIRTFYQQLQCRYKVNRPFSKPCSRSNGFCQGDSFSLQVALAVMFLWTKFVKCEPTRDLIPHTGSFVDESFFSHKVRTVKRLLL